MKYPLVAKNTIRIGSKTGPVEIAPGALFDAGSKKEAEILIGCGAAEMPAAPRETAQQDVAAAKADLLAAIAAAQSVDALIELVPEDDPGDDEIGAALEVRLSQLNPGADA